MNSSSITIRDYGATPRSSPGAPEDRECDAIAINRALGACSPGDRLVFEPGIYDLWEPIVIAERQNLDIAGNGALLLLRGFDRSKGGPTFNAIKVVASQNVAVHDFSVDMDVSPNTAGEIVQVGADFLDVHIFDEFPVTGDEYVDHIMTFHPDGRPDGHHLDAYRIFDLEKIADRVLRLAEVDTSGVTVGQLLCLYHRVYGGNAILFGDSHGCTLRDVTVRAFAGMGFVATDRSTDVTLERYRVQRPKGSRRLTSTNADGSKFVHTGGRLTVRDGSYEGMGDDAINIHSSYGRITSLDRADSSLETVEARSDRRGGPRPLPTRYVHPGDQIEIYDATTMLPKGAARIIARDGDRLQLDVMPPDAAIDDLFNNLTMSPTVRIANVTVHRNRARGFLLQSQDVVVEGCTIEDPTGVGIFVTTDVAYWYESGPGRNVVIRGNTIIGANNHLIREGVITVKCGHDAGGTDYPAGVHRDIQIIDNTIRDTRGSAIFACATDDITVTGNTIENCSSDPTLPDGGYAIVLKNCRNAVVSGNRVPRADRTLKTHNTEVAAQSTAAP
jgi:hypothetical protein